MFNIPNLLTSLNLFCGILAIIVTITTQDIFLASCLIIISLIADFLDGFAARALKVASGIGKELDSLADCVTFGVFPGVVMTLLIGKSYSADFHWELGLPFVGIIICVFSALRLAKFNLDERQSDCFYGLATPANTIFVLSLWLIKVYYPDSYITQLFHKTEILLLFVPVLSYLLISELRLIAFKFKDFSWDKNKYRFIVVILALLLLGIFQLLALPFVVLMYILVSVTQNILEKAR